MTPEELMAFNDPATPAAAPRPPAEPKGWWRRNLVALVSVVPLLALVVGLGYIDPFYRFWEKGPLVAVGTNTDGFSTLEGIQLRLVEMTPTAPKDSGGKVLVLPTGVTAWKAVIEYKVANPEIVTLCRVFLEDNQGRLFGNSPNELSRAKGMSSFGTCSSEVKGSTHYRTPVYFVLPAGAKPAAVRVGWFDMYPNFARLPYQG